MRRRRNNPAPASPLGATDQVFRYFLERLADEDYAPGMSDLLRLIQYRRDLRDRRQVCIVAGWVGDAKN